MTAAEEKVPYPEYRPRCYRDLERVLGESDALVEWLEVGARNVKREHDMGGDARTDALAKQCGVRVSSFDWDRLSARLACFQVVSVYQYIEWFLDEFRREHPRVVRTRNNGEDLVEYTLSAYSVSKVQAGGLECDLIDYYRKVRNHFLHGVEDVQRKTEVSLAATLHGLVTGSRYRHLAAPNPYDKLSFDDFVLASRAVKNFSRRLCSHTAPTVGELHAVIAADRMAVRRFRGRQQSPRLPDAIATYIQRRFGFAASARSLACSMLANGLLAQR